MDINRATKRELTKLKGVGRTLADRITRARPYTRLEDVLAVRGVSARLLKQLDEQGVFVGRPEPKRIPIKVVGDVETEDQQPLLAYVFDERGEFLGMIQPRDGARLDIPDGVAGKTVTIFVSPESGAPESPTIERFQRRGYAERRLKIPFEKPRLEIGKWRIHPNFVKMACCRVRGQVTKRIVMPNGQTRTAPLCHARVEICEVDQSPRLVLERMPADLLARLRLEVIELGTPPVPPMELPAARSPVAADERLKRLRTLPTEPELAELALTLQATKGIEATRALLTKRLDLFRRYWCEFEWLFNRFNLECLKTVALDEHGRFDTDISYPCYGDKPDLYFRVQQRCHDDDWVTVHAPSISCNTIWNYCCGDEVAIVVTNPEAATAPTPGGCHFPYVADDPASVGEWIQVADSEVFVVHAALLNTGKVLLFSGGTEAQLPLESRVWDPATGTSSAQSFADDLFCAHQIALADGRILVNGGSNYLGPHGRGIDASYTFDPISESWTKHTDMEHGRWYPTTVLLPDGRALTFSGRSAGGGIVDEVERFDPATNAWSDLPASADKSLEIYPTMHLLKDGRVFYTGCRWAGQTRSWPSPPDTAVFDPATNAWADVGPHVITNRTEGTSVLLPPARAISMEGHDHGEELPPPPSDQRVLVLGGVADTAVNRKSAEIIDMNAPTPSWVRIADMHYPRVNPNAVILPDRRVFVVGGVERYKFDWDPGNILTCEIFDSTSETWTVAATMANPRHYHSVAVLLPDGRVMTTGTTSGAGNDTSMEIYSPPYLFRGPRPRITGYPSAIGYGGTIHVETPDACRVRDACLVRPAAPTHHTDTEQRLVPLSIVETGDCDVYLTVPGNPALLPPGWYLLFILDDCEIPSVGRFVHVG